MVGSLEPGGGNVNETAVATAIAVFEYLYKDYSEQLRAAIPGTSDYQHWESVLYTIDRALDVLTRELPSVRMAVGQ